MSKTYKGIPVSPGIAIGKAYLYLEDTFSIPKYDIDDIELEKERLLVAIDKTKQEIIAIEEALQDDLTSDKSTLYKSIILLLEDKVFLDMVIKELATSKKNIEWVLYNVLNEIISKFKEIPNQTLSQRSEDISSLGKRLMRNLLKKTHPTLESLEEEAIILCRTLALTDTALIKKSYILGVVTEIGGEASHMAIMARALYIPAVLGIEFITTEVNNGDQIIINGTKGEVIVNPTPEEIQSALELKQKYEIFENIIKLYKTKIPITKDHKKLEVISNVEILDELPMVKDSGSQGIGLFRSEFIVLESNTFPDEEYHYERYKKIFEAFPPSAKITIRTLDLGGDKVIPGFNTPFEKNPFLGWRAIRFCLERMEVFKAQLKAILRAAVSSKNFRLMIPMITTLEEVAETKKILNGIERDLERDKIPYNKNYKFGIMVEVPSVVMQISDFAQEVDFFSIGTNDLIQYLLACDRGNEKVANIFRYSNPAVLKAIKTIIDAAEIHGIEVSMCGEMASDIQSIPVLIGMGLKSFSVPPRYTNELKKIICSLSFAECKELADQILLMKNIEEIEELVLKWNKEKLPDFFNT